MRSALRRCGRSSRSSGPSRGRSGGPDAIHMHASQQRMFRRRQPLGQRRAATGRFVARLRRQLISRRREHLDDSGSHLRSRFVVVASAMNRDQAACRIQIAQPTNVRDRFLQCLFGGDRRFELRRIVAVSANRCNRFASERRRNSASDSVVLLRVVCDACAVFRAGRHFAVSRVNDQLRQSTCRPQRRVGGNRIAPARPRSTRFREIAQSIR